MKDFLEPEIEVVKFNVEDIITSSSGGDIEKPGDLDNGMGWA